MKKIFIAAFLTLGITLGGGSSAFAATGNFAVLQTRTGSTELNPQPEPPGATDSLKVNRGTLQLNPQPEPPGISERKLIVASSTCIKDAGDAKKKAIAIAKINYSTAMQAASQAQEKALAHAKTLTDKAAKKAAILKAHRDFAVAQSKAGTDKNVALSAANQAFKNAILACKSNTVTR